uniref:Uncharacterized protein n=1 Tax=Gouania willdenowi TaxID=441366 RepID=A0A8C5DVK4_GOUWI
MESGESTPRLSTAAIVAIACNAMVAILLFLLFLILYRACRVPSSTERLPVLALAESETQQRNTHKYLLTTRLQKHKSNVATTA